MPGNVRRAFCLEGNQGRCGFLNDRLPVDSRFTVDVRTPEFSILQELGRMPDPQRRSAIVAAMLFLLGVTDMSNRAISFESSQIGVAPEGWTATLYRVGRSQMDGRKR